MAERLNADLLVLHVENAPLNTPAIPIDPLSGVGAFAPYAVYDPAVQEEIVEARTRTFEGFIRDRFTRPVRAAFRIGDPAHVIVEDADQEQADLVIIGHHHHRFLERLLLGSVASEVLKRIHRPLLILPITES